MLLTVVALLAVMATSGVGATESNVGADANAEPAAPRVTEAGGDTVRVKEHALGVIGEIEPVFVLPERVAYDARIDTGATTSSIDARDIQPFERDGNKWVRFTVIGRDGQKPLTLERKVKGTTEVKRKGAAPQVRLLVSLSIGLGELVLERDFTLTSRESFDFTVLIGRNVLAGVALVDVAKSRTLAGKQPERPSGSAPARKPSKEAQRKPPTSNPSPPDEGSSKAGKPADKKAA